LAANEEPKARWRHPLIAIMSRNAAGATAFFNSPPDRVLATGTQIKL
jgi:K+ transporter